MKDEYDLQDILELMDDHWRWKTERREALADPPHFENSINVISQLDKMIVEAEAIMTDIVPDIFVFCFMRKGLYNVRFLSP